MDRDEALRLLRSGEGAFIEWFQRRRMEDDQPPSLRGVDLQRADLRSIDLHGLDLRNANLTGADLSGLSRSISQTAFRRLAKERFPGLAERFPIPALYGMWKHANLRNADLHGARLERACLQGADVCHANLTDANLRGVDFRNAHLMHASLAGAILTRADFFKANLCEASLAGASLHWANVRQATLEHVDFTGAKLGGTTFIDVDLSQARGLATTRHDAPSSIDIATLVDSMGEIPEKFLRGCGLREEEIAYFRSVAGEPIGFYSCFVSYSAADEEFARRLHNDFQGAGIRCWKWDHDARTGKSIWGEIDQAIPVHDKVVLIASESSLKSPAVNREIERAIVQEDERGDDVLFPVRVDDYIFKGWEHERKVDVTKKVVADARNWTDPNVYQEVLNRLIRDLKPEQAPS